MSSMSAKTSRIKKWIERLRHLITHEPQNRQELVEILQNAETHHILDHESLRMMEGVLQVSKMKVRDIMIPRSQMITIDSNITFDQILPIAEENQHSRYPIIGENRDEILGILLIKDILPFFKKPADFKLSQILRPVIFIPESKRLNILLNDFRINHNHMAIVVDEYGGISGLVTIEDVLEEIVGEIEDESDMDEFNTQIKKLGDRHFTVKALTSIEDFNSYFKTQFSEEEFDTIGGLVMNRFGHLPKRGESIVIDNLRIKILHADNRRIRLLKVNVH
ncbi:MAG: CBS domain-containing protein [Gammaproteobacteria bacterium]|nr:CBS domain-containing protein [Gammaproteobacteria bacterium]